MLGVDLINIKLRAVIGIHYGLYTKYNINKIFLDTN